MGKNVVFVDDSATVLMSVEMALEPLISDGTLVLTTYNNPVELLDHVKSGELVYDLLITDINMPQMNGMDLVMNLKQISHLKAIPILALTTENSNEMKTQGKNVGLNGWITKPFSDEKIITAIKRVLKIR
ncbi:MAG: response regulator [Campylobacterales bacterium]|nr:response regulator [Campylobacterales bacterium]